MRRVLLLLLALLVILIGCTRKEGASMESASRPSHEASAPISAAPDTETEEATNAPAQAATQIAAALGEKLGIEIVHADPLPRILSVELIACDDETMLIDALSMLNEVLSRYPDGFFATLTEARGLTGFRIILCAGIHTQGSSTSGLFTVQGSRMVLMLDVTQSLMENRIHHELSHAIESSLSSLLPRPIGPRLDGLTPSSGGL